MIAAMPIKEFFRPSATTLLGSLVITGVATFLTMRMIVGALNGAGNAFELPMAVQAVLLLILWPWALMVRFGGFENMQILALLGFIASLLWVYAILCLKRWLFGVIRARMKKGNGI